MATPISNIFDIVETMKSDEITLPPNLPMSFAKTGVIQASIILQKDFEFDETDPQNILITSPITSKEVYLAGLYAYRSYALKEHDKLRAKAINFKTISFAVTGMSERAKSTMRIVWWCDNEIAKIVNVLVRPQGSATQMIGGE